MKKKSLIFGLALATLFSAGAGVVLSNNAPVEPIAAVAETAVSTETTAITFNSIGYDSGWRAIVIRFDFADGAISFGSDYGSFTVLSEENKAKITYKRADGTDVGFSGANDGYGREVCGDAIWINRYGNTVDFLQGDTITVMAGFKVGNYELKEDVVCRYQGGTWGIPEEETELKIGAAAEGATYAYDVHLVNNNLTWGRPGIQVHFETAKTFGGYESAGAMSLIEYVNAYGETIAMKSGTSLGNGNFLFDWNTTDEHYYAMLGDTFTFKKGFALKGNEVLAQDMKFIVVNAEGTQQLAPYTDELAPSGLTVTTDSTYSQITAGASAQMTYEIANGYGTAYFTSSDESIATVTKGGVVTGVAKGNVTITAHVGNETADFQMEILEASPISGLSLTDGYTIYVATGEEFKVPEFHACANFENGQNSAAFALTSENMTVPAVDTTAEGDQEVTVKVEYQGAEYDLTLDVCVYEIMDLEFSEVGIVDWFAYSMFVQYPNTSLNPANITDDTNKFTGVLDKLSYSRADGTSIPLTGCYVLKGGNLVLFPFGGESLTEDNFKEYYQEGDTLTIRKGFKAWRWTGEVSGDNMVPGTGMFVVEAMLQSDVEYRYDGNVWNLYLEYIGIDVESKNLTVTVGKNISAGVSRMPENATTGTFTYASSDESIATVSRRGDIVGVAAGTCTITVTLSGGTAGEKKTTLNLTVTDEIVGLAFSADTVNAELGKELDLSKVSATFEWASGKAGESVDLSSAVIAGYNKDQEGEQNVVITVTVDGVEYSGMLTVVVGAKSGGCGSSVVGVLAPVTMLAAGLFVSRKKKR